MDARDRSLGMGKNITRRDFIDGVAMTAAIGGLAAVPGQPSAAQAGPASGAFGRSPPEGANYPPMRWGIRGQEQAAADTAHVLRDGGSFPAAEETGETYDLIVVGAGLGGLSAAYYFRKQVPNSKILILDGCDDFGGHARRNEFTVDGRQLLTNGGTAGIWFPHTFTAEGKSLLEEIGVSYDRFHKAVAPELDLFNRWGLRPAAFFSKEVFGADRLVPGYPGLAGGAPSVPRGVTVPNAVPGPDLNWPDFLARAPLSVAVKRDLLRINTEQRDYLPGLTQAQKIERLRRISYNDYLLQVVRVDPGVITFIQYQMGGGSLNQGNGSDSFSAWYAYKRGNPGFAGMGLPPIRIASLVENDGAGEHVRLPDGNGGVARLLVRWLVPDSLPGSSMEDSIAPHVNYAALDRPTNAVRLRLHSTVVRVRHNGDPSSAKETIVTYVRDGRAYNARAGATVMACFNAVIPYLIPELPEDQKAALHLAVRKPRITTSVAVRNLRAHEKLGVANINCPGSYFSGINISNNPSLGQYRRGQTPNDPAILVLNDPNRVLEKPGLPPREQWRLGRYAAYEIPYETFERNVRDQLARALGPGGFDPARDIVGIMVNRWAHGYTTGMNELFDPDPPNPEDLYWIKGRKRFGRISIANCDAAAICLTQAGFQQSRRAVDELLDTYIRPDFDYHFAERV
jgi:spermidine dehydrogenase